MSVQVGAYQSLGKSPATGDLHLLVQLGNKEIHSPSNNCYHFLQISPIRNDNISQQQIVTTTTGSNEQLPRCD